MAISADDLAMPFAVECSNDPFVEKAVLERHFATFEEAMEFADQKAKRFRAVWVSEVGVYESPGGLRKEGWLWFWWTDATEYGEVVGRRTGWACDYKGHHTSYIPIGETRS